VSFGSPIEWSASAKSVAIVLVALLLLVVGAMSHAQNVVEASYACPILGGEAGQVQYSFFDATTCVYEGDPSMPEATKEPLDWLDPMGSALVFGIGGLVVTGGAVLALRAVVRRAGQDAVDQGATAR
jgi:hypothetical protein